VSTNFKFALKKIEESYHHDGIQRNGPKYVILYKAIKKTILSAELPHNWLLPSTRKLANYLHISRTTVLKAYDLLQLEKLIESKIGSGFRVKYNVSQTIAHENIKSNSEELVNYPKISEKGMAFTDNIALVNSLSRNHLAFRPGLPPVDVFPVNRWKNLLNTYWRYIKSSNLSYSSATGLDQFKNSIANYLNVSRNIKCNPEQIVIVSGSLQSLYLIATTLIDKGDTVILENPVFPNVHSVFKSSQANIIPCPLDHQGLAIHKVEKLKTVPKIIHVTPSNHYPLGTKMSLERRQEILEWASQHKTLIIENDYEHEISNLNMAIPTIYSLDTEDRTIYMGTFNRLLHPSIRLGYMIVPKYLVKTVKALQEHSHRFVSPSIQVVMNQFIERNYLYQHIKTAIDTAKERYALFYSEFVQISKNMTLLDHKATSFHVVAVFNTSGSETLESKTIDILSNLNVTVHALSRCYITDQKRYGLIFGYAAVQPSRLKKKIQSMKGVF
jgi:GntR family transcriptional regulator/MocR family aminotransferase